MASDMPHPYPGISRETAAPETDWGDGWGGVPSPPKAVGSPHTLPPPPSLPTTGVGQGPLRPEVPPLSQSPAVAPYRPAARALIPRPRAQEELVSNTELVQSYRQQIGNVVNQANLQLFWNMYNRCGRLGSQLAAPGRERSSSWGPPSPVQLLTAGNTLPQFVDEWTVEPPRGVTSCPGSHPARGRGGAGLFHSSPSLGRCQREQRGMWAPPAAPTALSLSADIRKLRGGWIKCSLEPLRGCPAGEKPGPPAGLPLSSFSYKYLLNACCVHGAGETLEKEGSPGLPASKARDSQHRWWCTARDESQM